MKCIICWFVTFQSKWSWRNTSSSSQRHVTLVSQIFIKHTHNCILQYIWKLVKYLNLRNQLCYAVRKSLNLASHLYSHCENMCEDINTNTSINMKDWPGLTFHFPSSCCQAADNCYSLLTIPPQFSVTTTNKGNHGVFFWLAGMCQICMLGHATSRSWKQLKCCYNLVLDSITTGNYSDTYHAGFLCATNCIFHVEPHPSFLYARTACCGLSVVKLLLTDYAFSVSTWCC